MRLIESGGIINGFDGEKTILGSISEVLPHCFNDVAGWQHFSNNNSSFIKQ